MHFKGISLSNAHITVGEEKFWKVVIIIEVYYYIFGNLLV